MSAFTKVLVFFVLVLSIGFAVSQAILYDRREDYGEKYIKASGELKTAKEELQKAQAALTEANQDLANARQAKNTMKAELEKDLADEKEAHATANANLQVAQTTINEHATTIRELNTTITQLRDKNQSHLDIIAAREKTISDGLAKISGLDKTIAERDETIRGIENTVADLKVSKQELVQDKADLERVIELAVREGFHLPPSTVPPIDGQVIRISPDQKDIVINKGKRDGVKLNFRFVLHNDLDGVLGSFIVQDLDERVAGGRLTLVEGKTAQIGDSATTEIEMR